MNDGSATVVEFPGQCDARLARVLETLVEVRQHEAWREQLTLGLHTLIDHALPALKAGKVSIEDFAELGECLLAILQCEAVGRDAPHRRAELSHRASRLARRIESKAGA
jgi:hypothetical protein